MLSESGGAAFQPARNLVIPVFAGSFGNWQFSIGREVPGRDELESSYDNASRAWSGRIARLGFEDAYMKLLKRVLWQERYMPKLDDLRALDAGIGTGAMASAVCRLSSGRIRLDGIDISEGMLRQADLHLRERNVDMALRQADIAALPYPNNVFDVVLAAHVLEHQAKPENTISELYRVLRPGGALVVCMTRRSLLGTYIQLLWRTHQVNVETGLRWLRCGGFQSVRAVPFDRRSAARRVSIGYVARKPCGRDAVPLRNGSKIC